jgi:hypothetical protein
MASSIRGSPSAGRPPSAKRSRSDGEEKRPENRRGLQPLIQGDALIDSGEAVCGPSQAGRRRALESEGESSPDLVVVLLGNVQHAACPFVNELQLAPREVEETDVEQCVGQGERVVQLPRQLHGARGPFGGAFRITEQPEQKRRGRGRHHTRAGSEAKRTWLMLARVEERDGSIQMLEGGKNVTTEGDARAHQQMPLHLEPRVFLLLGEIQELAADGCCFLELAAVEVEAGETAQHRE